MTRGSMGAGSWRVFRPLMFHPAGALRIGVPF
jgi:hypothetical protein